MGGRCCWRALATWTLLAGVWMTSAALAAEGGAQPVVAVSSFSANPAGAAQAPAVEALVGTQLAESGRLKVMSHADISTLIGIERQRQLVGGKEGADCSDDACMTELAGAVGARYVVSGRVDRFGEGYVLTVNLFDAQAARALVKARADAASDAALPAAVKQATSEVLEALAPRQGVAADGKGAPEPGIVAGVTDGARSSAHRFSLGLRVGNSLIASIAALNFSGDLELGWRFDPGWVAFLQVGATLVRQDREILPESFALVPSVLGVRHLYRTEADLQPYWGLGLGVQLAIGDFAFFGQTGPLPSVLGFAGLQYLVTERFSVGVEGSTNVAQMMLGLTTDNRATGFNFDLSGALAWRF